MTKKILVFGVTGQQGFAVARQLQTAGFEVRGFTRNKHSDKAKTLSAWDVDLFEGDLKNEEDILSAMQNVWGVFLVLPPEWDPTPETDQAEWITGKLIVDAAKKSRVQQLVYSSVMGSELQNPFRPLFKFTIEEYLRESGLAYTIFKPAAFYENFYMPHYGLADKHIYNPLPAEMELPFISVEDIGVFTKLAFQRPEIYAGKTLNIAGELLTSSEIAAVFSDELSVEITPVEVPVEVIKSQNELLGQFMEVLHQKGYAAMNLSEFNEQHPELLTLRQWIRQYGREQLLQVLNR